MAKLVGYKRLRNSKPEVFIVESLNLIDEQQRRHEGQILADILRMCGKNPLYYYIRTRAELEMVADEFEGSEYRYLHLSCHGGLTDLETTLDKVSYTDFATIFSGKLKFRRLFASACAAGNQLFSTLVAAKNNTGLYSVAAPVSKVQFDHAVAFWSAFYVKAFTINEKSMNGRDIANIMRTLTSLFSLEMHLSTYHAASSAWAHRVINGRPSIKPRRRHPPRLPQPVPHNQGRR